MLRSASFLGVFALAAVSPGALIVSFDPDLTIARDPDTTTILWITGSLDATSTSTANVSGANLYSFTATGSGGKLTSAAASVNSSLVSDLKNGLFTGPLVGVVITPTTPLGSYVGTAAIQLSYGSTKVHSSPSALSFTVTAAPVPEPSVLATVGVGGFALCRRRRRRR